MSKRTRNQNKNRLSLSRMVLGAGAVLLFAATAFFLFQNSDTGGGTPKLTVNPQRIEWGTLKDFTDKSFTITVTNTGTGILRFKETPYVQVVEGCCPPDLTISSMVLKPGESATVTSAVFMMHPGMDGKHNYAVHLITNDSTQPDKVVNVLSDWVQ